MPVELNKLEELEFEKQLTFAYLTCERLYPNYIYFSSNYGFGKPDALRKAINFLYQNIFENNVDSDRLYILRKQVEENTPDTEDFDTIFVSSALDACTCILDSLDFLLDRNFLKIKYVSSYGLDTADMYIREMENIEASDKNVIQRINKHPLMQKEVAIQAGIITFLSRRKTIDLEDVQTLINLQENNKRGSLNL